MTPTQVDQRGSYDDAECNSSRQDRAERVVRKVRQALELVRHRCQRMRMRAGPEDNSRRLDHWKCDPALPPGRPDRE